MKEGWVQMKLGDVCDFQGGSQPPKSQFIYSPQEGYVRFLQIRDFASDKNITYIPESKKNRYCNEEDILLGRYGASVGKVLTNKAGAYNVAVIKSIPQVTIINKGYLFYYFNTFDFQSRLIKTASRSAQDGFSKEDIYDFPVLIPPLPEQQRIVSIIDKAFEAIDKAIENTQKNLQNAKELFESYSQVVFSNKGGSWEERLLKDVCEYDKTPNKRVDLPYVGLEDIQSNTGVFLGPFEPRNMKSLTFYFNDEHVLYGRLRPYLNKVLQPNFEGHCSTEIFPILPKKNVLDRGFLFQWLIATETMKKINATWSGATLPRANMNAVLEFPINLPSIKDQQSIVRKMDTLSIETKKLESKYQQKLRDLEELKKSILNKAFAGEL